MATQVWDFNDGTGLTFDAALIQVAGGLAELARPAGLLFYHSFDSLTDWTADYAAGNPAATPIGVPTHGLAGRFGAELQLTGGLLRGLQFASAVNAAQVQTGCVESWYKPNFNNAPPTNQVPWQIRIANLVNRHSCRNASTGRLTYTVYDNAGVRIVDIGAAFLPVAGQYYHLSFNFDVTAGASRVFVDGNLLMADLVSVGVRGAPAGNFQLGIDGAPLTSNHSTDDLAIYDTVQRTANFTPPTTSLGSRMFSAASPTIITDPLMVRQLLAFRETVVGAPRYAIRMRGYDWFFSRNHFAWRPSAQAGLQFSCTGAEMTQFIRHFRVMSPLQLVIYLPSDGATTPQVDHIELDYNP